MNADTTEATAAPAVGKDPAWEDVPVAVRAKVRADMAYLAQQAAEFAEDRRVLADEVKARPGLYGRGADEIARDAEKFEIEARAWSAAMARL